MADERLIREFQTEVPAPSRASEKVPYFQGFTKSGQDCHFACLQLKHRIPGRITMSGKLSFSLPAKATSLIMAENDVMLLISGRGECFDGRDYSTNQSLIDLSAGT